MHNQQETQRIYNLNKQLLEVLHRIGFDLVKFADKYDYPIPQDIPELLDKSQNLINEINEPTSVTKTCSICNKVNPSNADFCCYCGCSLVITRIRQNDESPFNATEGVIEIFI